MKKLLLAVFCSLLPFALSSCQTADNVNSKTLASKAVEATTHGANFDKVINQIYYYSLNIGFTQAEYKIDLKNKKLYQFTQSPENIIVRNPKAENEGYQKVDGLSQDKVATFLKETQKFGFADWNGTYILKDSYDGYQWGIKITFDDGTEKEITGRNAFPETWNDMGTAFYELSGIHIIDTKSDEQTEQ